jgi:hypothetical protein
MQLPLGIQAYLRRLGPGFALRRHTPEYQRFTDPVGLVGDEDAEGNGGNRVQRDKSRRELST